LIWFYLGRHRGNSVLRVALPASRCTRIRASDGHGPFFARHGVGGILASKFLPGLGVVFPPLAGMGGMSSGRFLFFDAIGSALYAGLFSGPRVLFSNQLHQVATALTDFSRARWRLLAALAIAYFVFKYLQRQRLSRLPSAPVHPSPVTGHSSSFQRVSTSPVTGCAGRRC